MRMWMCMHLHCCAKPQRNNGDDVMGAAIAADICSRLNTRPANT